MTECCSGSLLLSLKFEENGVSSGEEKEEVVRVILRCVLKTLQLSGYFLIISL